MQDSGIVDLDNTDINGSDDDGARVSTTAYLYYTVSVGANCLQVDDTEDTNTDNDDPQHIDTKCVAVPTCVANSSDHRKIVSHIFGRNKACTRDLPNNLWIFWCRKHYQRFKYRGEDAGNWHTRQLDLVRNQLQTFEDWGEIRNWNIVLRKAEQDTIAKENKNGVTYTNYLSSCWERFLVPFLGPNKTFAQVRDVLNVIERKFNEEEYRNRDKRLKTFPGIEFLPAIHKAKEVKKRPTKKGGTGYKKITLDQAAFKRKTRANAEFLKDEAAKKREASNTPKGSRTAVKKEESPDTDNASDASTTKKRKTSPTDVATQNSAHHKRKSVENTTVTPNSKALSIKRNSMTPTETLPAFQSDATPTKRRRLTRGYEKHGSEGEDSTFMEKEDEE